ncbi:MAG: C45 family autoproteolytic acyltransferase/hydrolase [Promethearchaeota archaeon]
MSKTKLELRTTEQTLKNRSGNLQEKKVKLKNRSQNFFKRRRILAIFIIILGLFGLSNLTFRIISYHNVVGIAEWRSSNSQDYLYVEAEDPYAIGYLTGEKLSWQILNLKIIILIMAPGFDVNYIDMLRMSKNYLDVIPSQYIKEMQGMADGATHGLGIPITFNDILLQNTFLDIFYGEIIPNSPVQIGCTAIIANNSDGQIILGQNFDFNKIFAGTISFVHLKQGDKPSIFTPRFGAMICLPMGKNENNVSILTTVVKVNVESHIGLPISFRSRYALMEAKNASDFLDLFFNKSLEPTSLGYTMLVADKKEIYSIDNVPINITIEKPNYKVKTNTFTNEFWQQYLFNKNYSKNRQNRAEELFNEKYSDGILNLTELKTILSDKNGIIQKADNSLEVETIAFITSSSFGKGILGESMEGAMPI